MMGSFSRLHKIAVVGLGATGGAMLYYKLSSSTDTRPLVHNSWTTNFTPSVNWDNNWDHRAPSSIVKPSNGTPEDDNRYNSELEEKKPKAVRHFILIRHGQYNLDGATDKERILTELGRTQASLTGQRLASLDLPWNELVISTMTRAQETGELIAKQLPEEPVITHCPLLEEGAPIPPEPPIGHWRPEPRQFFQDGARIEAAFRKYFHRASPDQSEESYMVLVCHANVIRYLVCRALQFPAEAWLRLSLNHGSITWISVMPNGHVVLRVLGDTGYMPPKTITSRNVSSKD